MAIWQFKMEMIPESGLKRVHGGLLPNLGLVDSRPNLKLVRDAEVIPNYWDEADTFSLTERILTLLDERPSWDKDARMFGEEDGNQIDVWPHFVSVRIDMRKISKTFIDGLLSLAADFQLVLVVQESLAVVRPRIEELVPHVAASRAQRFCKNPLDTLRESRSRS